PDRPGARRRQEALGRAADGPGGDVARATMRRLSARLAAGDGGGTIYIPLPLRGVTMGFESSSRRSAGARLPAPRRRHERPDRPALEPAHWVMAYPSHTGRGGVLPRRVQSRSARDGTVCDTDGRRAGGGAGRSSVGI